jgi:protein-disulfide isomerase
MKNGLWAVGAALSLGIAATVGILLAKPAVPDLIALPRTALQDQVEPVVRNYLVNNPQVIAEALQRLQQMETQKALGSLRPALEQAFPGTVLGNPDGDVTIVEFSDYRCPFCKRAHLELQAAIAADPMLRVVVREVPILDQQNDRLSRRAAEVALAAAMQGKYSQTRDALFAVSGQLRNQDIIGIVRRLGLNERQLADDMKGGDVAAELQNNFALAQKIGLSGTPTYVIGDQTVSGLLESAEFARLIAAARTRAR